ncbi:MAG: hypothetical protein RL634_1307 [Bacteroidota bacterium]|jgi:hypothetical protein|nr:DUF4271 domain-containing protein [Chitinophagia bacterium]
MRAFSFILFIFIFQLAVRSQDSTQLSIDSARNAFILNHKPLTFQELNHFILEKRSSKIYGSYTLPYIEQQHAYPINRPAIGPEVSKRRVMHLEWIFYSFAGLFLLLAFIRYFWGEYFDRVFLVYFNQGFILRQKKDAMMLWSLPSALLNILFVLAGSFFLFFGLGSNYVLIGMDRWQVMIFMFTILSGVYFFKYFFLQFLGWIFKQHDAFEQYSFIVFLNNKILGILMLVASFIMAFSEEGSYKNIFTVVIYLISILFGLRLINAFRIFIAQTKAGFFNILLAFISLELLPTAMLLKFASQSIFLLTDVVL